MSSYDYIIVGAGSAGCVLANRLSADPACKVLLVEAGGEYNYPWLWVLGGLPKVTTNPGLSWNFVSAPEPGLGGRQLVWPRGRVLGGSSSINGMVYIRGQPEDYDTWARGGAKGWAWADVLPYFKLSERQSRGADEFHGANGPMAVSDLPETHPLSDAFLAAGREWGLPANPDFNGRTQEGVGYYQYTMGRLFRSSTARAYLAPARRRPNLTVMTKALALRVVLEGTKAVGVEVAHGGQREVLRANSEVIVAAGAVQSPQLLMLSGIGPAAELRRLGIEARVDAPGVGQGIQDHLQVKLTYRVANISSLNEIMNSLRGQAIEALKLLFGGKGAVVSGSYMAGGFLKSDPAAPTPDIQLHFQPLSAPPGSGQFHDFPGCTLTVSQTRPKSRGNISLASSDPSAPPTIRANYLDDSEDRTLVVRALKIGREIMQAPAMRHYSPVEVVPGRAVDSDAALLQHARDTGYTQFHVCGGCRMGTDEAAVVDSNLRVRGAENLRIIDASVMPAVVSGNTNAAAVMIGEKGAAQILRA